MFSGAWHRHLPYLVLVTAAVITVGYLLNVLPGLAKPGGAPGLSGAGPSPTPFVHSDGLSDSHDGYLIQPVALPVTRGTGIPVAFRILAPDGKPQLSYEIAQTRPLYLYLIRDDVSTYQQLHPELVGDTWSTTVDIHDGGAYRFYAEFVPQGQGVLGHPTTLGLPFVITGDPGLVPLPAPVASSSVDGFTLTRLDGIAHLRAGRGSSQHR